MVFFSIGGSDCGDSAFPEQHSGPWSHWSEVEAGPGDTDPYWDQFGAGLALREGLGSLQAQDGEWEAQSCPVAPSK